MTEMVRNCRGKERSRSAVRRATALVAALQRQAAVVKRPMPGIVVVRRLRRARQKLARVVRAEKARS